MVTCSELGPNGVRNDRHLPCWRRNRSHVETSRKVGIDGHSWYYLPMPESTPIPGRWLEKVAVAENGCWLWSAAVDNDGYGKFQYPVNGRQVHIRAHRWAYEHFVGPIRDGDVVMHVCDTPPCVNPNHLDTGSPIDNNDDKIGKGRGARVWGNALNRARQTHCKNGHPLWGRNLWINPKTGHRRCRQCSADRARKAYHRPH